MSDAMHRAAVYSNGLKHVGNDLSVNVTVSAGDLVVELGENVDCDGGAFSPIDHDDVGVFLDKDKCDFSVKRLEETFLKNELRPTFFKRPSFISRSLGLRVESW